MGVKSIRAIVGACAVLIAAACYFWSASPELIRVAPADLACWHNGLKEQPGLYADQPGLLAYGSQPLDSFIARVTQGRLVEVPYAWTGIANAVRSAKGRACDDVTSNQCDRAGKGEESHIIGLFYKPEELPQSGVALPDPGETVFVDIARSDEKEPLVLTRVPSGILSGPVPTCRWYASSWTIPDAFHYPFRSFMPWIVIGLAVFFIGATISGAAKKTTASDPVLVNARRRTALISLVVTCAGFIPVMAPSYVRHPDDWMYAAFLVSVLIVVSGVVVTIGLWRSAARFDRLFAGETLLVRWDFAPEVWRSAIGAAHGVDVRDKRRLLKLIGIVMVVIGGGFVAVMRDEASLWVLGVLAAIFLVLVFMLLVVVPRRLKRLQSRPGVVLVGSDGVYLSGEFHDWRLFLSRFDGASVTQEKDRTLLVVSYAYFSRFGYHPVSVHVPVPAGEEDAAKRVAQKMSNRKR